MFTNYSTLCLQCHMYCETILTQEQTANSTASSTPLFSIHPGCPGPLPSGTLLAHTCAALCFIPFLSAFVTILSASLLGHGRAWLNNLPGEAADRPAVRPSEPFDTHTKVSPYLDPTSRRVRPRCGEDGRLRALSAIAAALLPMQQLCSGKTRGRLPFPVQDSCTFVGGSTPAGITWPHVARSPWPHVARNWPSIARCRLADAHVGDQGDVRITFHGSPWAGSPQSCQRWPSTMRHAAPPSARAAGRLQRPHSSQPSQACGAGQICARVGAGQARRPEPRRAPRSASPGRLGSPAGLKNTPPAACERNGRPAATTWGKAGGVGAGWRSIPLLAAAAVRQAECDAARPGMGGRRRCAWEERASAGLALRDERTRGSSRGAGNRRGEREGGRGYWHGGRVLPTGPGGAWVCPTKKPPPPAAPPPPPPKSTFILIMMK